MVEINVGPAYTIENFGRVEGRALEARVDLDKIDTTLEKERIQAEGSEISLRSKPAPDDLGHSLELVQYLVFEIGDAGKVIPTVAEGAVRTLFKTDQLYGRRMEYDLSTGIHARADIQG